MASTISSVRGGDVDEVIRPIARRRAVDARAQPLQVLEEIAGDSARTLEHQVLEEVGEASLVPLFVLGTDVIPQVYGDERQTWLTSDDDVEAVVERRLVERRILVIAWDEPVISRRMA